MRLRISGGNSHASRSSLQMLRDIGMTDAQVTHAAIICCSMLCGVSIAEWTAACASLPRSIPFHATQYGLVQGYEA